MWIPGWDSIASAHSWNNFYFGASICALILLGVFEVIPHRYAERNDELAAVEQIAVQRRPDSDMVRVQHDSAQANAGAAKANEEAAKARAEQERLKQLVVWHSIPDAAGKDLITRLSATKATITLAVVANDPEAFFLGSQIATILAAAGWESIPMSVSWGNWLPIGMRLYGQENETLKLFGIMAQLPHSQSAALSDRGCA